MAVRNKKQNRKTKRHVKSFTKSSSKAINVRSLNDVKNAINVLKKSKITIVFVYADWCPHCHTYKPLWDKLQKRKGPNVGMVSVEQKNAQPVLENIKDETGQQMEADSFPKIIAVSNGTGAEIPNSRDEVAMTNLVANGDKMMANNTTVPSAVANKPASVITPDINEDAMMNVSNTNEIEEDNIIEEESSIKNEQQPNNIFTPPQLGESNIKTPTENSGKIVGGSRSRRNGIKGGSLYESLVAIAGTASPAAPAIGLLAAQQFLGRKRHSNRKTRRFHKRK
jgi:thiol-disulfide isomerase/thioredoxin